MEQLALFDYGSLDAETRTFVESRTDEIMALVKRSAQDVIEIGVKLSEVKERLPHGQFGPWLEQEFGWKVRTAQNFMRVAERFKSANFAHLDSFAPSALYALAAPSTPDSAVDEAISLASEGQKIGHSFAKEIVNNHKQAQEEVVEPEEDDEDPVEQYRATKAPKPKPAPQPQPTAEPVSYEEKAEAFVVNGDAYEWNDVEELPPEPEPVEEVEPQEKPAKPNRHAVHFSSDSPEHYTPSDIVDSVVAVLRHIDLDPCSNSKEAPNVPATTHYTAEDDGLSQFWQGTIYMNPPYGRGIGQWIDKLCEAYESGDVPEAIALVPARPDTQWWRRINNHYPFVCFVSGRLRFVGNEGNAPFPSAIFYLGENAEAFFHQFQEFGDVMQRLHGEMFGA